MLTLAFCLKHSSLLILKGETKEVDGNLKLIWELQWQYLLGAGAWPDPYFTMVITVKMKNKWEVGQEWHRGTLRGAREGAGEKDVEYKEMKV